jgi:hippurate hydrolase
MPVPVEAPDFRYCCALHSNRMMIEEAVMARGIAMHCAFAEAVLSSGLPD